MEGEGVGGQRGGSGVSEEEGEEGREREVANRYMTHRCEMSYSPRHGFIQSPICVCVCVCVCVCDYETYCENEVHTVTSRLRTKSWATLQTV